MGVLLANLHDISRGLDRLGFLDLLVIELTLGQVHLLASEVFDSEAYSTKFDGIKLLNFVVKFALRVL